MVQKFNQLQLIKHIVGNADNWNSVATWLLDKRVKQDSEINIKMNNRRSVINDSNGTILIAKVNIIWIRIIFGIGKQMIIEHESVNRIKGRNGGVVNGWHMLNGFIILL